MISMSVPGAMTKQEQALLTEEITEGSWGLWEHNEVIDANGVGAGDSCLFLSPGSSVVVTVTVDPATVTVGSVKVWTVVTIEYTVL